jgi:hypothetical protein
MFTLQLRGEIVRVRVQNDDVLLFSEDGTRRGWRLTDEEWEAILSEAASQGYETDSWAYVPLETGSGADASG